jgi:3-oxoisoapionate kinase
MTEADLRRVLAAQTALPVELVDVLQLERGTVTVPLGDSRAPAVLFDTLREAHLPVIGRALAELATAAPPLFIAGSSGVEYALTAHWTAVEPPRRPHPRRAEAAAQVVAVSGSCSPVTARQIARAEAAGFATVALDPVALAGGKPEPIDAARDEALAQLRAGRSVILHSSLGPEDPRAARLARHFAGLRERGGNPAPLQRNLALEQGALLRRLAELTGRRRLVVCGGDTSTHVARALGIEALEYLGPMAPGSPLCRAHAPGRAADGAEIVFKGGQVGRDDFFLDVLRGGPPAA